MTASGSGAPDRESATAEASRPVVGRWILAVLVTGLVFRLIMAYGIEGLRGSGFDTDLNLFRFWATNLAEQGPFGFHDRGFYADYTPGYLYALWLVGVVGGLLGGVGDLIKLPAIITDVILAIVVYRMVLDLGVTERRATIAAAAVVLNPITWFDSVIWGQVDSFGTVFLLLSVRELWRDRPERAAVLAVVAGLVKPQLLILVPVIALVTIRRALWPAGGFGSEPPPEPSGTGWERRTRGPLRILSTGVAGFVTAVALSAPFGLSVISLSSTAPFVDSSLVRLILSTAAQYSYITVNAYNAWALFPVDGQSLATGGGGHWILDGPIPDATSWAAIGPVPAGAVGAMLLLAVVAIASIVIARRPDRLTILVGVCVLALAFFAVPTRVHERYLFPLFGLAAILFAFSWRWRIAYVAAGTATFLNMYAVLTTLYPDNPSIDDWLGIGGATTSFGGVALVAVLHTAAFAWALAQLRPAAARTLEVELEAGRRPGEPQPAPAPLPEMAIERSGPGWDVSPGLVATPSAAMVSASPDPRRAAPVRLAPAWFDPPSWTRLGPVAWLRARVGETPIRPNRSALLASEGRGRLDRLDLWFLLVLVIAALCLRTFRLAEPARMHFDEVYHARTAAEFLQAWRYGISHNIYEWTHPHLAKYAMAGGIVLFAGHDTAADSDLGLPVRDAAIEPRRLDPLSGPARLGERAWVVTGAELAGYDLATRALAARWPVPGASAVAYYEDGASLYVGTDAGELYALDVASLDETGDAAPDDLSVAPELVATLDGPIRRIAVFDDGQRVGVLLGGDRVAVVDPGTGEVAGTVVVDGAVDLAAAGSGDAVLATPADVGDAAAVAAELALVLDGDAANYEADLARTDLDTVTLGGVLSSDIRTDLQAAIDDGRLPGISIGTAPWLAVAGDAGVRMVTDQGEEAALVPLGGPARGLAVVTGVDDAPQLYATTSDEDTGEPEIAVIALSGDDAPDGPEVTSAIRLPGAGSRLVFDAASELVEVVGAAPDDTGTTVYVVEPHGKSVFADHRLPFEPAAWALDHDEDWPTANRGELLVFAADGRTASLDIGHYPFAWRLPGVIMGAVTAAALYLLARILFRRREVGILVGLFVLLDGMLFVQGRIAMNDVYTGAFILAAYALFAWLWIDPGGRPRWAFWTLFPVVGLLLGLALASKWVAAYAIGALAILVLLRSALGRLALIVGLLGLTAVLGWMAMAVPAEGGGSGNLAFALLMIGLTLAAVVISVYRPVAWSDDEVRLAVGGPLVLGALVFLGAIGLGMTDASVALGPLSLTPFAVAFALVAAGVLAYAAFLVAGRLGFGPLARAATGDTTAALSASASPPPDGWLRPGSMLGLPVLWMLGSMIAIPLAVYVASYLPWAFVEGQQMVTGWPPGHDGQTLLALTGEMYRYHNNLTAAHAASSPWWAWPLNLKPVWFYQGSFANDSAAAIYDAGNLVLWWLGIPAMAFVAYQAFRRRSLALALVVVAFLAQWVSWARIDRAAFQYHYYTALPFVLLALAYFVAELWHGASRRTWLLARASAAVAIMGPALLWLFRGPLCAIANVAAVNKDSQACTGNPGNLVVTPAALVLAVGVLSLVALVVLLVNLLHRGGGTRALRSADLVSPVIAAIVGVGAVILAGLLPADEPLFKVTGIVPEPIALVVLALLALVAVLVVSARDARRFALAIVLVAGAWFVLLYPNISALPLPSALVNAYQGILPTYLYAFQFAVNTVDRSGATSFADARFALLVVFLVIACVVVAYSAWTWRVTAADRTTRRPGDDADGPAGATGPA